MSEQNEYLLGTHADELARLGSQHNYWKTETRALLDAAGFASGERVLDLGAGPGYTSAMIAEVVGASGSVTAVDTSDRFARWFEANLAAEAPCPMDYHVGDVHKLSFAPASYDVVFARWLFCFLADPEAVVAKAAALLKPGGKLVVYDYYHYLAVSFRPYHPALARAFEAVHQSFADSGGSLDVGDVLPGMAARNGFELVAHYPVIQFSHPGEPKWRWFRDFETNFFPKLVSGGYLTQSELDAFVETLDAYEQTPGCFFSTPPMFGMVAEKRPADATT